LRQTVEGLQQARANGAYCVGITDTFVSPIVRFANECFLTSVEAPFSNSYVAPISFINILFAVCAHYRRARTLEVLKQVDQEQRHGFRWYPG
jgi:DNA-binding MurR/RpiR family transcriptional regulator